MSVEAMGWAFRQRVPPKPKIVLLALADQTDETTGRVCYGKTDLCHLAKKCSIPERSLSRFIAALVRNGYILRDSGKERGQANLYWLCLDRTAGIEEWKWLKAESEEEPQDVVEGSANLADPGDVENAAIHAQNGLPPSANGGRQGRVSELPSDTREPDEKVVPTSFSRQAQESQRENRAIAKAAEASKTSVFVIEGSRAWDAWIAHRRRVGQIPSLPTCTGSGEFSHRRGWYLPSLFPPAATGPPQSGLSDQEIRDFK